MFFLFERCDQSILIYCIKQHNTNISYLGNVCRRYSETLAPYFWAIANAQTPQEYNLEMARLETFNIGATNYLKSMDRTRRVTAFYLGPYY